jgi:hypothetical protein
MSVVRALAVLVFLVAHAGCGVPLQEQAAVLANTCQSDSDCASGATCASLASGANACIAVRVDLPGLLLEVRPNPSASIAADTSYLVDPSNPGMYQFAQDSFNLQRSDPAGIVQPFDVRLPKLITIARGVVQASVEDVSPSCTPAERAVPVDIELQRVASFVGIPSARYVATTVTAQGDPVPAFKIAVVPDSYNIYVSPTRPPSGGDKSACTIATLPPAYFPSQSIDMDADLNITLPPLKSLHGTLAVPQGASLEGWALEIVEPSSGRPISTTFSLSQAAGVEVVAFELSYYWTFKDSPILRLRPPDKTLGPMVHWELASVDLGGGGSVTLTLSDVDLRPKHVEARVVDAEGQPVVASVEIQSTKLSGLTNASYKVSTETGADGAFAAELLLGDYRVLARPILDNTKALGLASWPIKAEDLCCGRTLELSERTALAGAARTPGGRALVDSSVVLSPSLPKPSKYLANALGLAVVLPRESSTVSDATGAFAIGVDPGQYDLSIRPREGSYFSWIVRSRLAVSSSPAASNLGPLEGGYPAILRGTIQDGSGAVVAGAVVRAWLPIPDTMSPDVVAETVMQVAEAKTDDGGRYVLPLPTSLAQ